jgi:hypothetical protein
MIEKTCNLWLEKADFRCIPTNGAVADGEAVLDHFLAKEAADRYQGLGLDLGRLLTQRGNHVHELRPGLLSFPIKQFQWSGPALDVIGRSAEELAAIVGEATTLLPRPGCGDGELAWEDVAGVLASLPDNVIVIQHV